jgi:hypothetical protein
MLCLSQNWYRVERGGGWKEIWRACLPSFIVVDSLIVWLLLLFIGALIACTYAAYEEISIGGKDEQE